MAIDARSSGAKLMHAGDGEAELGTVQSGAGIQRDLNGETNLNGCDAELREPAAFQTACQAVEDATGRIIAAQSRMLARLIQENADLRARLGR